MSENSPTIEETRAFYDSMGNAYPAAEHVTVTQETINNLTCHWFQPENAKPNELVIYVHGGGYAIGSLQSHKAMVTHFVDALERTTLFVEYSLAPEHPYPAGLNEVVSIYEWATQQFPAHDLYLVGDSAGGGLIISSIHEINQKKLRFPKGIALLSPWYNLETNTPSLENRQSLDQSLTKEMLGYLAYMYAGANKSTVNPSNLNIEQFPPVFVAVGTNEILFDDSLNFYDMVYKIQPNAELKVYGGQGHVFPQKDISSHSSQDLIANMTRFFNSIGDK